jgi:hypothetical protein
MSFKEASNDINEITLSRRILNNVMKDKVISKQEATVLLANLDLCICSEQIETINLSGSYRLDTGNYTNRFYNSYANRIGHDTVTMDDFFNNTKNCGSKKYVPHYVGGKMQPVWPPSEAFSRAMLVVHRPWKYKFDVPCERLIEEFMKLYNSLQCPLKIKLIVAREKHRHESGAHYREQSLQQKAINYTDFTEQDYDEENEELIALVSTLPKDAAGRLDEHMFDYGKEFDWHAPTILLPPTAEAAVDTWTDLTFAATTLNDNADSDLRLPKRYDGTMYELKTASHDQKDILAYVLNFIRVTFASELNDKPKPLRMTITGVAGSGKSTLIHTLTTAIRIMFGSTDSVVVCAPTGNAASNVSGTTCHFATKIGMIQPLTSHINPQTLIELKKNFARVVCLIVDERSLLSSKVLARMEYNCRHATNNGLNQDYSWGNIPIVLVIGDDYQLPPVESGAFQIFNGRHHAKEPEVLLGELIFEELGKMTMSLGSSKRILQGQEIYLQIMAKLRSNSQLVS